MANLDTTIQHYLQQDTPSTIPTPTPQKLNVIIRKRQLKQNLANFLNGALFSPRPSTLNHAIRKNF
mgnify:FL=1